MEWSHHCGALVARVDDEVTFHVYLIDGCVEYRYDDVPMMTVRFDPGDDFVAVVNDMWKFLQEENEVTA